MGPGGELPLGQAAAALGHLDPAVEDLQTAASICDTNGARGCAVQARVELAAALTRRQAPGDRDEALAALAAAAREAKQLEMVPFTPARKDEKQPRPFPNWLRQRVEAVIWTLKNQLGLERHGGRIPAGLWARVIQRLLALNACIWHNWLIGAPVKRSLIAYDHV